MGRLGRMGVIFLVLMLAGSLLALALGWVQAGPMAAGASFALLALAGLALRGRRPGFTRGERRQVFGRWHD